MEKSGRDEAMEHVRRGTLLILIVMVLAASLIWYYFAKVYDGNSSVRGTLVEQEAEFEAEGMENLLDTAEMIAPVPEYGSFGKGYL